MTKKKNGRPLKFKTPDELQNKIEEYFVDYCGIDKLGNFGVKLDQESGKKVSSLKQIPTISSLAIFLDVDRETISNYAKKDKFFGTIKKAKEKILSFNESALYKNAFNTTGVIFNLKNNWGWKDRNEVLNMDIDVNNVSDKNTEAKKFIDDWFKENNLSDEEKRSFDEYGKK